MSFGTRGLLAAALLGAAAAAATPAECAPAQGAGAPVVVYLGRTGDPESDALWLAIAAHLEGLPVALERAEPAGDGGLEAEARRRIAAGTAAAAIWLSGETVLLLDGRAPATPAAIPVPETGEGWESRCAQAGSLLVPLVERIATPPAKETPAARAERTEPPAPPPPGIAAAPPAEAAPPARPTVAITPRAGIAIPTSRLQPAAIGGIALEVVLPALGRRLSIGIDATYARLGADGRVRAEGLAPADYELRVHEVKWAVDLLCRLSPAQSRLAAFAGGGPIAQLLVVEERTSLADGANEARGVAFGVEAVFVFEWRLWSGGLVIDARYAYTDLDLPLAGDANAGNATVAIGYRIEI